MTYCPIQVLKNWKMEDNLNVKRPQWKNIVVEDNWNLAKIQQSISTQPQQVSQVEPELGTAQPQLVFFLLLSHRSKTPTGGFGAIFRDINPPKNLWTLWRPCFFLCFSKVALGF